MHPTELLRRAGAAQAVAPRLGQRRVGDTALEPASIQYMGLEGSTSDCKEAVYKLLQFRDPITSARILTSGNQHGLLLTIGLGDLVGIKAGFTSGYNGEGPRGLSRVLCLLDVHGVEIDEVEVRQGIWDRLNASSLTQGDIEEIQTAKLKLGWPDYVFESDWERSEHGKLWDEFPAVIPFAIIDPRISDLAVEFEDQPDGNLLKAYRRLEDIVRDRTGLDEHGVRLFSQAFRGPDARLAWEEADQSVIEGRTNLFVGAYMAFRNPRAHRELLDNFEEQVTEFLLINQLFHLERAAVAR